MVIPGKDSPHKASVDQVAEATVRCLLRAVPGIIWQSDELATAHLNAMNAMGKPWPLSFSYGRALQTPAVESWKGQPANVPAAQKALFHRAKCNSAACFGRYKADMERESLAA